MRTEMTSDPGSTPENDDELIRLQMYQAWTNKHAITKADIHFYEERMKNWAGMPTFHIFTTVNNHNRLSYIDTISSLQNQLYPDWKLSVLTTEALTHDVFTQEERAECHIIESPHSATLELANMSTCDWVCLIEAGDMLAPEALFLLADYIDRNSGWQCVYVDEDRIDEHGNRLDHRFKPDFNLELLRSSPYMGRFLTIRQSLINQLHSETQWGALCYSLALQIADIKDNDSIGHIADILHHGDSRNDIHYLQNSQYNNFKQALQNHLQRNQISADIKQGYVADTFFVDYQLHQKPLVTIIIPTKDALELVRPCISSLLDKTTYTNFEVILVDNNSTNDEALEYFDYLDQQEPRVRVLRYPKPYNFSAINNYAAKEANGEYLVLLNNDTLIIQDSWLERMLSSALQENVGIVGAKLYHQDGTIQHAGVVCGIAGVADHVNIGLPMTEPGYMGRTHLPQDYSVVTAACLMISRSLYQSVGGMDEEEFAVLFNDVDLCLKVKHSGKRVVWTPHVNVMHYGSVSLKQKKTRKEEEQNKKRVHTENMNMLGKWMHQLTLDPAYNRNLSLRNRYFSIDVDMDSSWDAMIHDAPRIMALPFNNHGVGQYRVIEPLRALANKCQIQASFMPNHDVPGKNGEYLIPYEVDVARIDPDVYFIHNGFHNFNIEMLKRNKRFFSIKQILGIDDLMHEPPPHHLLHENGYKDIKKRIRTALSYCDRLIVSTEPLAEAYSDYIEDIKIIPNGLNSESWINLNIQRGISNKTRIGWAGAGQHACDFDIIIPVVMDTMDSVEWVFFGDCPSELKDKVEYHPGVPFQLFPEKLASLGLDLAVAPLAHNKFNEARSNLKLLEYGILGIPVICSDIEPYQHLPVTRVKNHTRAWVKAINEHISDIDSSYELGNQLKQVVLENYLLNNHLDSWFKAMTEFDS